MIGGLARLEGGLQVRCRPLLRPRCSLSGFLWGMASIPPMGKLRASWMRVLGGAPARGQPEASSLPKKGLGAPVAGCGLMGPHHPQSHLRPQSATLALGLDLENWQEFLSGAQGFRQTGTAHSSGSGFALETGCGLFIYLFWLQASHCSGFCCCGAQALGSWAQRFLGSRAQPSVAVVHGHSCSVVCGIFLDQGWNSYPCIGTQILYHQATREVAQDVL